MKIGEFTEITGLTRKTALWLYDNQFCKDGRIREGQRRYTDKDVEWVLLNKVENFEATTDRSIAHIFNNYYVSDDGRVFTNSRGFLEEMSYEINSGYRRVRLTCDGIGRHYKVSKLVAYYFVDNPENKPIPNHIDGNKLNDDFSNLEWSTYSENTKHAYDTGLAKNDSGFKDSQSHPVAMYSNDGKLVRIFGSMREASRLAGVTLGYISGQLKRGANYGTNGYYFKKI